MAKNYIVIYPPYLGGEQLVGSLSFCVPELNDRIWYNDDKYVMLYPKATDATNGEHDILWEESDPEKGIIVRAHAQIELIEAFGNLGNQFTPLVLHTKHHDEWIRDRIRRTDINMADGTSVPYTKELYDSTVNLSVHHLENFNKISYIFDEPVYINVDSLLNGDIETFTDMFSDIFKNLDRETFCTLWQQWLRKNLKG